jgi:hypothetical protein
MATLFVLDNKEFMFDVYCSLGCSTNYPIIFSQDETEIKSPGLVLHYHSQKVTEFITKFVKEYSLASPKRGDVFKINLIGGRPWFFFWDGEKIMIPEDDDERFHKTIIVPSELKIPKEFPINHWDSCGIISDNAQIGNFCYNTSDLILRNKTDIQTFLSDIMFYGYAEIISDFLDYSLKKCEETIMFVIYFDIQTDFHIILPNVSCNEKWNRFLKDGRCYRTFWNSMFSKDEMCRKMIDHLIVMLPDNGGETIEENVLYIRNYIASHGDKSKCIYIE